MVEKSHTAGTTSMWPGLMEPLRGLGDRVAQFFAPTADAASTDAWYEINVELPGVKAEDIGVDLHDNTLTVHGEKRAAREEQGKTWFFSERSYGSFHRSFRLPPDVMADEVEATVVDGVLTLRIPKSTPASRQARKIEVKRS